MVAVVVVKANLSCATLNAVVVVAAVLAAMEVVEAAVVATKVEEYAAYCCFYFLNV